MFLNKIKSSIVINLLLIEIKMNLRNQKLRNIFFLGFLLLIQYITTNIDNTTFIFFAKPIYISIFSILYCEYLFSNQSSYYSFIVTKDISDKSYIYSKYYFIMILNAISLIFITISDLFQNKNLEFTLYSAIFSFGIIPYLLILIALTNRKKIVLEREKTSNFKESNYKVLYVFLILFFLFLLVHIIINDLVYRYYIIALLGLIGIVLNKFIIKILIEKYRKVKSIFIKFFITDEY